MLSGFFSGLMRNAGKWVRVEGWGGVDDARDEIMASVAMYREAPVKPNF